MKTKAVFLLFVVSLSVVLSASVNKIAKEDKSDVDAQQKVQEEVVKQPSKEIEKPQVDVQLKETQVPVQVIKDPVSFVPQIEEKPVEVKKDDQQKKEENKPCENSKFEEKVVVDKKDEKESQPAQDEKVDKEVLKNKDDAKLEEVKPVVKDAPSVQSSVKVIVSDNPVSQDPSKAGDSAAVEEKPSENSPTKADSDTPPQAPPSISIQGIIQGFQENIGNLSQSIANFIRPQQGQAPPSLIQSIQNIFSRPQSQTDAITPSSPNTTIPAVIQQNINQVQNLVSSGVQNLTSSLQNIINPQNSASNSTSITSAIFNQVQALQSNIANGFQQLNQTIQNVFSERPNIIQSVQSTVQNITSGLSSGIQNLLTPAAAADDSRPNLLSQVVGGVAQRLQEGVQRLNETVQTIVSPPRVQSQVHVEDADQSIRHDQEATDSIKEREKEFIRQVEQINLTLQEGIKSINEKLQSAVKEETRTGEAEGPASDVHAKTDSHIQH